MTKGYKGRNPRGGKGKAPDEAAEEEFMAQRRQAGGQSSNVGMLPPSDSEDDEEEGGQKQKSAPAPAGQPKTAGLMPPSDSEDDDASSAEEPEYFKAAPPKKKETSEARDPELIAKEMEKLKLIRAKREEDRQKRILADGWDRFAPVSETNKPPHNYVPPKPVDDDDD